MKRRAYTSKSKEPTLYCDNTNCNNVSSKLCYVEEKVVEGLKKWLEQYRFDYQQYVEKSNCNKIEFLNDIIVSLESDIKKENDKLSNIFNFLEDGTYTKETFDERRNIVLSNIDKLNKTMKEYEIKLEKEKVADKEKKVLLPKIENIIDIYYLLQSPEEKNDLLKLILNKITYLKTEKAVKKDSDPTKFTITLYPKIKYINKI